MGPLVGKQGPLTSTFVHTFPLPEGWEPPFRLLPATSYSRDPGDGPDPAVSQGSRSLKLRVESRVHETKPTEDTQEAPSNPVFKGENSEQATCGHDKGIVQ